MHAARRTALVSLAALADTADAIGGSRLRLLPNETHMAPVERARGFRREVVAFRARSRT